MYVLKRDDREVFRAETYNECLVYLQRHSPHSWDYCFKYAGYCVEEADTGLERRLGMKKILGILLVVVLVTVSSLQAGENEDKVLRSLEGIRAAVEGSVTFDEYKDLIVATRVEIRMYEHAKPFIEAFHQGAIGVLNVYINGLDSWQSTRNLQAMVRGVGSGSRSAEVRQQGQSMIDDLNAELHKSIQKYWVDAEKKLVELHKIKK